MRKKLIVCLAILSCFIFTACGNKSALVETPAEEQVVIEINVDPPQVPLVDPDPDPEPEPIPIEVLGPEPLPVFNIDFDRHDAIYNHELMVAVYLGMPKEELEEFFTPGDVTRAGYIPYDDHNFFVEYWGNDTVRMIIVFERDSWVTFNGITSGSPMSHVINAYGEPLVVDGNYLIYYTYHNELLDETPSYTDVDVNFLYSIRLIIEDDEVHGVTISKF